MHHPYHKDRDPRQIKPRILDAMRAYPDGITVAMLAEITGEKKITVSSVVSKTCAWGGPIEKGGHIGPAITWRLKRPCGIL